MMNDDQDRQLTVGGLQVLSTGLNLAELDLHGGPGFWAEVQRFARESRLGEQLDTAMSGRSAPRIWAFCESPGASSAAAAAALMAAWMLAERGQVVVLVDADEQEPRITRWLGRTEQEGWIDMVRFGASLQAASCPLPLDGVRGSALGIGTFAPTGITPDEVADLLSRLRRQADDLILVLPAKLRSQPWLAAAHIRLLCWDLLARSAGDTEKIVAELERMGAKPEALLGFGVEEFCLIQGRLREEAMPAAAAEPAPVEAEVAEAEPAALPAETPPIAATEHAAPEPELEQEEEQEPSPPRTSRVFVFVAVAAIAVLALLGVFLRGQLGPQRPSAPPIVAEVPVVPAEQATPWPASDGEKPATADQQLAPGGEQAPPLSASPEPGASVSADREPAPPAPAVPPTAATAPAAGGPAAAAWDGAPYQKPVGQDGWTLWLYSLPDQGGAESEVRRLAQKGIQAEYRAIELPAMGRWYRVYAGSFTTSAEAAAAAGALLDELKHNWAQPVRF